MKSDSRAHACAAAQREARSSPTFVGAAIFVCYAAAWLLTHGIVER